MTVDKQSTPSVAAEALSAAGDRSQAEDVATLERASEGAQRRLGTTRRSLVERMIFGPLPDVGELCSGVDRMSSSEDSVIDTIVETARGLLADGDAFDAQGRISQTLRSAVAAQGAYGFTVPNEFGGKGLDYSRLARLEEKLAANGLCSLAVEISGQLTIGSSALLGYGTAHQRSTFLPQIADGKLIAFALTEVGVGVNAKRVQAWVDRDDAAGCWRLNADGACSKLYITSATHGCLAAVVARKGRESREIGLFIVQLPDTDVDGEYGFHCASSNVGAFSRNINSRMSFRNFPVPFDQEIQGNGIEVLFYCLRMGRCMLAAMSAGLQRMMAADALHYARNRYGVGGQVIRHELPRLGIARIVGGALTAQSLAHLSLAQDAAGVELTGLRDLTKSASARYLLDSLIACERVIGGRSLDKDSRLNEARMVIHAFGIVEGEDDLIRLGMVKDLTARFNREHLQPLLGVLAQINTGADGNPLPEDKRILKLGLASFFKHPVRTTHAVAKLCMSAGLWQLLGWVLVNGLRDIATLPAWHIPVFLSPRYRKLPGKLGWYLRFAERGLRRCRWRNLFLNAVYQLELTRAQLPMQRLAKRIELFVAMAATCAHASRLDAGTRRVAEFQAELMRNELSCAASGAGNGPLRRIRKALKAVAQDIEAGDCSLIETIDPQPWAHPWDRADVVGSFAGQADATERRSGST